MKSKAVGICLAIGMTVLFSSSAGEAAGTCPIAVAHRGESASAPEETGPAFVAAGKGGAKAIEMDIRFTRDNVPVLFHDPTVDRTTTSTGYVSSFYFYQINRMDAGHDFNPGYDGIHPYSLNNALWKIAPFSGIMVIPELKTNATTSQLTTVANTITARGMTSRTIVQSFYASYLLKFHAIAPTVKLALTTDTEPADPVAAVKAAKATYWLPNYLKLTPEHLLAAHAAGIKVFPWTVDDPAAWEKLTVLGVDGILTNRSSRFVGWSIARCGA